MRRDGGGTVLDPMIEILDADADMPPKEVAGVNDAYLDGESPL